MIPLLILAGLAIAGTAVAITFWDQIKKYLALAFDKVKKIINASSAPWPMSRQGTGAKASRLPTSSIPRMRKDNGRRP